MTKTNKKKVVKSLLDDSGKEFLIKGRHPCLCEASKHNLINNCLNCGRIVCEQEGTGDCFTCGTYILSKEERTKLLSDSAEANERISELVKNGAVLDFFESKPNANKNLSLKEIAASLSSNKESLDQAIKHKDKMLDFDQKNVARTKVFDDQVDYFTIRNQNFVTDENRTAIAAKVDYLVENKFNKTDTIVLDLENLQVSDYAESVIKDLDEEHRKLEEMSKIETDYEVVSSNSFIEQQGAKPTLPALYIASDQRDSSSTKNNKTKNILPKMFSMNNYSQKVQDKELEKLEDRGMCLAMRQPYASLLVAGIKRFEGRAWYSTFKGRLWIYAAQKVPTLNEINKIEDFYRQLGYSKFPHEYPTGAIVGCVTVEDCLPNEVYSELYPECEIDSPYAFICDYPISFTKPLPVINGGGNKIYKLEFKVHDSCKKILGF